MYDRGLASTTRRPPRRASATSLVLPEPLCALKRSPALAASRSTTANPTLCRVSAYFKPGLPSPTTRPGPATGSLVAGLAIGALRRFLDHSGALDVDLGLHVRRG